MYCRGREGDEAKSKITVLVLLRQNKVLSSGDGAAVGSYRFLDDVKALLVNLKRGHFLDDLLQEDVLFVIVTFNRQLQHRTQWLSISKQHVISDLPKVADRLR